MRGTGLPLVEPDASCEVCATLGTIGRAVRSDKDGRVVEIHRFCRTCWPAARAQYRERWEAEARSSRDACLRDPRANTPATFGYAFEGAAWDDVCEFIGLLQHSAAMRESIPPGALAHWARECVRLEEALGESMPLD